MRVQLALPSCSRTLATMSMTSVCGNSKRKLIRRKLDSGLRSMAMVVSGGFLLESVAPDGELSQANGAGVLTDISGPYCCATRGL